MPDLAIPYSFVAGQVIAADQQNDNYDEIASAFNDSIASKLADSSDAGKLVIVNNTGTPAYAAMSGHATLADDGELTIANGVITEAMLTTALQAALGIGARDYAEVLTEQTTTSANWTDLATVGPSVTLTVPAGLAVVAVSVDYKQSAGNGLSVGVHEATDRPISGPNVENEAVLFDLSASSSYRDLPYLGLMAIPVTAGSRTFTLKYSTGPTGTATFKNRKLWVTTLGGF